MYLFGIPHLTHPCYGGKATLCSPHPLQSLKRRGRSINRPFQPMKTGGNNPDKRQIWSLSYKTNFNCTPFFKSSSGWRTTELNLCGCRICFSLIALSGHPVADDQNPTPQTNFPSFFISDTQNCWTQSILCLSHHIHVFTSSYTDLPPPTRSHMATTDQPPKWLLFQMSSFVFSHGTYAVSSNGGRFTQ